MIQTENLFIQFPDGSGIRYRDLTFETGRAYALLGASGCGKSTLLSALSGIRTPAQGRVVIDGQAISQLPQRARDAFRIREIGCVFQDFKLMEEMTVQDNIAVLRLEGVDVRDMDALLSRLGILALKRSSTSRGARSSAWPSRGRW